MALKILKMGHNTTLPKNHTFFPLGQGYGKIEGKERDISIGEIYYTGEESARDVKNISWISSYAGRPLPYLLLPGKPENIELKENYIKAKIGETTVEIRRTREPPFYEIFKKP